jgi:putative GTP pyrophosphokinase
MILERKQQFDLPDPSEQDGILFQIMQGHDPRESMKKMAELIQVYTAAMKGISTKLEVLDDEFQITHKHNPIHHLECRIKGVTSIFKKIQRYGLSISIESARTHIHDIAGIRVICNFVDDIYEVEKMLIEQPDVTLIKRKDYISQPKENGYRSLHIVVTVPVFLSAKTEDVPVEIQLRTIAMDYWASLEHMLRYKNNMSDIHKYSAMLLECANTLANTEKTMQYIREKIEK